MMPQQPLFIPLPYAERTASEQDDSAGCRIEAGMAWMPLAEGVMCSEMMLEGVVFL